MQTQPNSPHFASLLWCLLCSACIAAELGITHILRLKTIVNYFTDQQLAKQNNFFFLSKLLISKIINNDMQVGVTKTSINHQTDITYTYISIYMHNETTTAHVRA